jgi:hypothetical protein
MNDYRNLKFNASGYYDPTAFNAIQSVILTEEKANRQSKPKRVYIASPYKGDTERNVINALKYCRFAVVQNCFPIAPHCYLPRFMNDDNPAERELALFFGLRLLNGCKELWVFGEQISDGMRGEIDAAKQHHIPVRYFSTDCKEVNKDG